MFGEIEGSHPLVKVDDGGIDIKPPGPSRLFDMFGQATYSIERAPDTLKKACLGQLPAELHGGSTAVKSEDAACGKHFYRQTAANAARSG